MQNILSIGQLIVSIALIIVVLLQERSSGIGGAFGGGGGGDFYQTRRGLDKVLLAATIVLGTLFGGLAIASLFVA